MLDLLLQIYKMVVEALRSQGSTITVEQLAQQFNDYLLNGGPGDLPEPIGPPEVYITDEGRNSVGHAQIALRVKNLDGQLTSIEVYQSDLDPDGDGNAAEIIGVVPGKAIIERGWAFGYRRDIGRIGGYTSRLGAIRAEDWDEHGNVVALITLSDDDAIELQGIAFSGIQEVDDGSIRTRYFFRDETAMYIPAE